MTAVADRQSAPPVAARPSGRQLRGRPELYTSYSSDMALLNTPGKKLGLALIGLLALAGPFFLTDDILVLISRGFALAIGAIGLNLVTGYAGQVSLGHAFFVGIGAFTAATLNGDPANPLVVGYGLPIYIWLPAAGLMAGAAGLLVAPLASRLRGLYLAIVTLGLVFLGEYLFREADFITGGFGVGRAGPRAEVAGFSFSTPGDVFGQPFTFQQKIYFFVLFFLVLLALAGRNIARSDIGRAFAAVRDRDVAAEVIGVPLFKTKLQAFTISSFYAGICGALLYTVTTFIEPGSFSLLLSVQFIAMVLIGGVATISGSIMGAMFIGLLPRLTQEMPRLVPFVSAQATGNGLITAQQLEAILYGLLIIVFLIFEPRGLYGVWIRVRNYWKGWPFSY